jgi:hypothetical protein
VSLRSALFALLGLLLTGVSSAGQRTWTTADPGQLTAWLGYMGAGGAVIAGLSALAISLSARERGPVRAFALAAFLAAALFLIYAARGGLA